MSDGLITTLYGPTTNILSGMDYSAGGQALYYPNLGNGGVFSPNPQTSIPYGQIGIPSINLPQIGTQTATAQAAQTAADKAKQAGAAIKSKGLIGTVLNAIGIDPSTLTTGLEFASIILIMWILVIILILVVVLVKSP